MLSAVRETATYRASRPDLEHDVTARAASAPNTASALLGLVMNQFVRVAISRRSAPTNAVTGHGPRGTSTPSYDGLPRRVRRRTAVGRLMVPPLRSERCCGEAASRGGGRLDFEFDDAPAFREARHMTAIEIIALLEQQFGPAITAKSAEALDPFVAVEPARLVEVCTVPSRRSAPQVRDPERHLRRRLPGDRPQEGRQGRVRAACRGRLSPVEFLVPRPALHGQGCSSTLERQRRRAVARCAQRRGDLEDGGLAGTRSLRLGRRELHGASKSGADFAWG